MVKCQYKGCESKAEYTLYIDEIPLVNFCEKHLKIYKESDSIFAELLKLQVLSEY
jgi:hypothetical protein